MIDHIDGNLTQARARAVVRDTVLSLADEERAKLVDGEDDVVEHLLHVAQNEYERRHGSANAGWLMWVSHEVGRATRETLTDQATEPDQVVDAMCRAFVSLETAHRDALAILQAAVPVARCMRGTRTTWDEADGNDEWDALYPSYIRILRGMADEFDDVVGRLELAGQRADARAPEVLEQGKGATR